MKINHIGLNINGIEDIYAFYTNILGFDIENSFELSAELSGIIFGNKCPVQINTVKKDDIVLELFNFQDRLQQGYTHICIETSKRELMAEKCLKSDYPVVRIERKDKPDLLFIKDKAGNTFELKKQI